MTSTSASTRVQVDFAPPGFPPLALLGPTLLALLWIAWSTSWPANPKFEGSPPPSGNVLAAAAASAPIAKADPDEITTGLVTDDELDANPPHLRVSWINWDSGFRGTGLQPGDKIVAVDGVAIAKPSKLKELQLMLPKQIGQYAEYQGWKERSGSDDQRVVLKVISRSQTGTGTLVHEVVGKLRATRRWSNPSNQRQLLGDGPERLATDGFSTAWAYWYEHFVKRCSRVLDGGWSNRSISNRSLLEEHAEDEPRIKALVKNFPGAFAKATEADFKQTKASLQGTRYQLDAKDLAYRQAGEELAAKMAATGKKARTAFLKAHKRQLIEPFPAVDPIRGDRSKVADKLVVLPTIENRDWVMAVEGCYLTKGQPPKGWYFVGCQNAATRRMMEAQYRFQQLVTPKLGETYSIIGRIGSKPKMLVIGGRGTPGLAVEPVAATVGDQMFVDLTKQEKDVSRFAGEETLTAADVNRLAKDASPKQVMDAWIAALKSGDQKTWSSLYATWTAEKWKDDGSIYYVPHYKPQLEDGWTRARRKILGDCFDIRVAYVSDVRVLVKGTEFKGAPKVESVTVELDHVGKFGTDYRAFVDVSVHRQWILQRRKGGSWRITGSEGI